MLFVLLASCSSTPSVDTVATSVAGTVSAQPTSTPIPTNTPVFTTVPSLAPSITNTRTTEINCSEDYHLVDVIPGSGKGILVTCNCSGPRNLIGINLIIPTETPDTMVDDGFRYVQSVASLWGWDLDDIDTIFRLKTKECTTEFVTSGEISGFCMVVGQESTVYSWINIK